MAHFLGCLAGREQPKVAASDGLRALELAEAANESLRTGQAVDL
jgi:predicted dehydrogenase